LKKLMMVVAILALALVVAAPAIAQVQQAVGQESETGNFTANFTATQSGNNSSQCVTPLQFGNTGSLQNGQAVLQYGSQTNGPFGDVELEGSTFEFSPSLTANCSQAVQQSAAASSN
jgi:Tfp pilus assembly protein FimT